MHLDPTPPLRWTQLEQLLLDEAAPDLADGGSPLPRLAAAIDDEVVALGVLRPFEVTGPVTALVEVLALLLPLGVNRVALRLGGRAWSAADPIPPVSDTVDLRAPVLLLVRADGSARPCRVASQLHELRSAPGSRGWSLGAPIVEEDTTAIAPLVDALGILLDHRDELEMDGADSALVAQLGRVLLLGHELALAPELALRLTAASGG